nr:hypothetical protein [Halomonas elongata]
MWVKKAGGRKGKEVAPISFDKKDFIDKMNVIFPYYNKVRLLFEMSGKKVLEIDCYDSLTREGVSSVMDHIGAPQPMGEEDVATSHKKVIKKDYAEVVENWGEARDFLDMLDVDENMGFFDFYKKVMGRLDLAS